MPNLRRRYEAGSWSEREELEPYRALRPCPECHGERLRPESRAVRVKGRTIDEYVSLPISEALRVFEGFQFTERENLIAGRLLREIRERMQVPARCRRGLPDARRGARRRCRAGKGSASGWPRRSART